MKKAIVFIVSAAVMLTGAVCQAAEPESVTEANVTEAVETEAVVADTEDVTDISLDEISEANQFSNLFQNYELAYAEIRNFEDPLNYQTVIVSPDTYYIAGNEFEGALTDGYFSEVFLDEEGNEEVDKQFTLDGSPIVLADIQNSLITYNSAIEYIVSITRAGDEIHLYTRVDSENVADDMLYYADELQEGDCVEYEAVLDASTLACLSSADYVVHADGTKKLVQYAVFHYDVEGLPQVDAFIEKINALNEAADGTRKVTFITDPGTEEETTVTYEVPKGQYASVLYDTETYDVYLDAEGTLPASEAQVDYDVDVTRYFIKKDTLSDDTAVQPEGVDPAAVQELVDANSDSGRLEDHENVTIHAAGYGQNDTSSDWVWHYDSNVIHSYSDSLGEHNCIENGHWYFND